jgi:hypothetical protein
MIDSATHLDAIQVVEQYGDEVVVQVFVHARLVHEEGEDGEAGGGVAAEELQTRVASPPGQRAPTQRLLATHQHLRADKRLHLGEIKTLYILNN